MSKDLLSIQYLRAIAALMVVLVHMEGHLTRLGYRGGWPSVLNGGVDIFFVISGFIMWVTTANRTVTPWQFLYHRLLRIAPLYWILTTLTIALMVAAPSLYQGGQNGAGHIFASYLFIPAEHPLLHTMVPVLLPGWTLNYEMMFYLLLAVCLPLRPALRMTAMITILGLLALSHPLWPDDKSIPAYYTQSVILEFAFGMALGAFFISGRTIPSRAAVALVVIGALAMIGLSVLDLPRVIGAGIPAAMIVAGEVYFERAGGLNRLPVLSLLGDASYSLYLTHGLVLSIVRQIWLRAGLSALPYNLPLFVVFAVSASCITAFLSYRYVEQPILAIGRSQRWLAPAPIRGPSNL